MQDQLTQEFVGFIYSVRQETQYVPASPVSTDANQSKAAEMPCVPNVGCPQFRCMPPQNGTKCGKPQHQPATPCTAPPAPCGMVRAQKALARKTIRTFPPKGLCPGQAFA